MRRSFHSPITGMLREAHAACTEAAEAGARIDEVAEWRPERGRPLGRRQVMMAAGAATFGSLGGGAAPRVVIIGAGLAGLACARALWAGRGIAARVYEWNSRAGGRVQTLRGYFAGGLTVEQHGQFISSEHVFMRRLASTYGLELADANSHLGGGTNETGWYDGKRYTAAALARDWQDYAWALFRDAVRAAPSATYLHATAAARAWDNISVTDWVRRHVPGGTDAPLGALCLAAVTSEYGSPPDRQSALNLIYLLGYDASAQSGFQPRKAPVVAGTDEKYQVVGGNDQIIDGLAGDLPSGTINLGHRLLAVRQKTDRSYLCTFQAGSGTREIAADHVVLAIPPTTLRDVELSGIPLLPVQRRAIAGATLGNNAKLFIQLDGRPWIADGYTGTMLTDQAVSGGWDASNTQQGGRGPNAKAIFVCFPGGTAGARLARRYGLSYGDDAGPAPPAMVADALAQLEPIYPGVTASWRAGPGKAFVNDGNIDPFLRGAYSNFLIGQYTSFGGAQSLPAGNLHFAGEHTSVAFQGFMEGAVRSGVRAASEI